MDDDGRMGTCFHADRFAADRVRRADALMNRETLMDDRGVPCAGGFWGAVARTVRAPSLCVGGGVN